MPEGVLASAPQQYSREQRARIEDAARAHSMMLSPTGQLHPLHLSGYLADPHVPLDFFREIAASDIVPAVRVTGDGERGQSRQLAIYSVVRCPGNADTALFNAFGSFLAAECGFEPVPLYGDVFFCRPPDPDSGVIAKLPGPVKDMIAFKLLTAQAIFEGIRLDYVTEEGYRMAWARLKALVQAHKQDPGPDPAAGLGPEGQSQDGSGQVGHGRDETSQDGGHGDGHGGGRDAEDALSPSP